MKRENESGSHGELRVGDEVYHVEADITGDNRRVIHETKRFPNGYLELWDYLRQFANKTRVINTRPFC